MFMHAGPRPLWPVIAFLPWLLLGIGFLLYAARQSLHESLDWHGPRVRAPASSRVSRLAAVSLAAIALLVATRLAHADPVGGQPGACEASTSQEARSLADRLYDAGQYQRAGVCYQAAGDLDRANLAFLKAAGPRGQESAAGLRAQRDAARALFAQLGRSLKSSR